MKSEETFYTVYKINITISIDTIYCTAPVEWIEVNSLGFIMNNKKAAGFHVGKQHDFRF